MRVNKFGKISSLSFVLMLVISTFAIAYMIGNETKMIAAETPQEYAISEAMLNGLITTELQDAAQAAGLTSVFIEENNKMTFFSVGPDGNPSKIFDLNNGKLVQANSYLVATDSTGTTSTEVKITGAIPAPVRLTFGGKSTSAVLPNNGYSGKYIASEEIKLDNIVLAAKGTNFVISTNSGKDAKDKPFMIGSTALNAEQVNQITKSENSLPLPLTTSSRLSKDAKYLGDNKWQNPSGAIYSINSENKAVYEGRGQVKTIAFGTWDFGTAQLIDGLSWAVTAAGIVQTLGRVFGMEQETLDAATAGIAAGIMVGKATYALLAKGGSNLGIFDNGITTLDNSPDKLNWLGRNSGIVSVGIGAATAWLTYNAMWSKTKTTVETVTFDCLPWQAPNGGQDCELCNDETLPCSEYRCKSLGQSCEIVNKGTIEERCVNINPRDSSPPVITPLESEITEGYEYFDVKEMPPGAGFKIGSKTTSNKCIPAYTPIKFAINTNEPSQCKIDLEPQGNYSRMAAYMGGNNLYQYNHTEFLNLPSSADIKNSSLTLKNGRELVFYIRCKDAAGNSNEADYALTLCVDPSPDTTAPVVQGTSIKNAGCVPADAQNATVEFYINEPAQCRWNYVDTDYEQMKNDMSCSTNPLEINAIQSYTCTTKLNGIARDGTKFFIRCKDQPSNTVNESKRNTNKESYEFTLRGSNQLKLKVLRPNETIYGAVRPTPVELYAETLFGCEDNKAICYYSTTDSANSFIQFFDTDKVDGVHTQRLDLNDGTYTYFVRCVDAGGNVVNTSTTFKVSIDVNAPVVVRAYEEDGYLKLVTPLNSECVYNSDNCDYLFSEGTQMPYANSTTHVTQWFPDKKYFIKCRDEYRSEPVDCSLIVRPTENFLGV